ncbi:hypothetical protein TVAG_350930 [Trichomonas vaginalis G3]|uniref:Thioredoxin domain-containing protein n=1 Tax=Trichomonas vaginalis (strain ATCC PRA-98 / G3) TaxID=412133 RepID=A2FUL9_TRIV3|nr:disulfide-isomerase A6 family [Trichomonas vaginalis G3]EAX91399.1 hypothetical protein TVAG_350930 [Trichomonas vaginalis G3]KAI5545615.1 disulfide-isomerase A6 family [Trichomonas vaginalis G3]|eukprot:XP_001304329.1 hypothetical protein [Trichomonas vaginalis G3]
MNPQNEKPFFLMFTSSSCPHCVNAKPIFEDAGRELSEFVEFKEIKSSDEAALASKFRVLYVPAFFFVDKGEISQYSMTLTKDRLVSFIGGKLSKNVKKLQKKLEKLEDSVIVFTKRFTAPSNIAFASCKLSNSNLKFYMVNKQNLAKEFQVEQVPSILLIKDGVTTTYTGPEDFNNLYKQICNHFGIQQSEKNTDL